MVEINSWLIFGVFLKKNKKILLIGGSGILGSAIINSKKFKNLDYPSKKKLDVIIKNLDRPKGICFSADEKKLHSTLSQLKLEDTSFAFKENNL